MVLILGAGYIGAAVAELALARGEPVTLADNWHATGREQLDGLERAGARVETADVRDRAAIDALLELEPDRVVMLAAQASRPLSEREPDYTEQVNLTGARRVAEALAASTAHAVVHGSSLHVYGGGLSGEVGPDAPYGEQGDLAHMSKVYAELVLGMHARRGGYGLVNARLGIVYGPSPVEHERPRLRDRDRQVPPRGGGRRGADARRRRPRDDRRRARGRRGTAAARLRGARPRRRREPQRRRRDADRRRRRGARRGARRRGRGGVDRGAAGSTTSTRCGRTCS